LLEIPLLGQMATATHPINKGIPIFPPSHLCPRHRPCPEAI